MNTFDLFSSFNMKLWKEAWKYWYENEPFRSGINEYIQEELDQIKKEKGEIHILDLGCGSAWCAKHFINYYTEYVGVDFNEELIEQLSKDFSKNSKSKFYTYDLESKEVFPIKDKKFNVALANFILLELADIGRFFQNVAELQEKGDYLIITGLDPVKEIMRISDSTELDENLNKYYRQESPLVILKGISLNGKESNYQYLRILYSTKDIINEAFLHSYELVGCGEKCNPDDNSPKPPLYYTLKFMKK